MDNLTFTLPCPIGGTLYRVVTKRHMRRSRGKVHVASVILGENNLYRIVFCDEVGKVVFTDRNTAVAVAKQKQAELDKEYEEILQQERNRNASYHY